MNIMEIQSAALSWQLGCGSETTSSCSFIHFQSLLLLQGHYSLWRDKTEILEQLLKVIC